MTALLLLLNGFLIAALYALGRVAADAQVPPLGLLYWQTLSGALVVGLVAALRGERPGLSWRHVRYYAIAGLLGTTLPYLATYSSLRHLPAGIIGIVGSLSAVFTYAIALSVGTERANMVRSAGIAAGLLGVLGILLPKGALPGPEMAGWVLLAAAAPLALAAGNVYRSRAWPAGLSPLGAASGMLLVQVVALAPAVVLTDSLVLPSTAFTLLDRTLLALAVLASAAYAGLFVLQRRGGPLVVSQLGYVITVATLAIGIALLGERYSNWVWLAVALVFLGVYLVNRTARTPVPARAD